MIVCNLTKPESTFDAIRKEFPKLAVTDAALVATALIHAGRFADAVYDDRQYQWPDEFEPLAEAVAREIAQIDESVEPEPATTKKAAKPEVEEPATIRVGLLPSVEAGEVLLKDRKELKKILTQLLDEGVEFMYSSTDIIWPWSLERANWANADSAVSIRYARIEPYFLGNSTGTELGPGGKKPKARKKKVTA